MKIRFQADADLNEIIVAILLRRVPEIDFQTATMAGLEGLSDPEVLAMAAMEGRILVSHDQSTMPEYFARFIMSGTSPGVFIIPQHLSLLTAADELCLIWIASEPDEWTNRVSVTCRYSPGALRGNQKSARLAGTGESGNTGLHGS